jgi:hypothetical protein
MISSKGVLCTFVSRVQGVTLKNIEIPLPKQEHLTDMYMSL